MAHERIDGMLIVAKLKRGLLGGAAYTDVAIRRDDGDVRRLGTLMILDDMKHALVPGSRGRFYAYNVAGSKGIYAFRPEGRPARGRFPIRWEIMMYSMGLMNILMAWYFFASGSGLRWLPLVFGILLPIFGIWFTATRMAAMRTYREDEAPSGLAEFSRAAAEA